MDYEKQKGDVMNLEHCIRELETNAAAIECYLSNVNSEQARWKPSASDWSILEVVNHLLDEEINDFPHRIRHLLSRATTEWEPIYPAKWVTERSYNERDFKESLSAYLEERRKNLSWVKSLSNPDWDIKYQHEPLAGLSAGDLMVSWIAHDLLSIRQLNELKYAYGLLLSAPYSPEYAGDW
jgi:DinB family protein